jgi:predicted RNase H-like nuclease (RuvC/YqgF family)
MADLSVTLSEIELKIRKLIALKNQLEEENSKLIQRNEDLQLEIEMLMTENSELKDKINKLVIVNVLDNDKEVGESRQLIKALVKEIDKCVAMLNAEQ